VRIVYFQPAQRDLARLREFLRQAGVAQTKGDTIIRDLVKSIHALAKNPLKGYRVGGRYGFYTPYRALVAGRYLAIYEVVDKRVKIRRIYHQRENYLAELLPSRHPDLIDDGTNS
jgi:plasmid stabilization system protein ParE